MPEQDRRRNKLVTVSNAAALEQRVIPSAVKVDVTGGVVKITGTPDADNVKITPQAGGGFLVSSDAASTFSLNGAAAAASVAIAAPRLVSLDVNLADGSDTFLADRLDASIIKVQDSAAAAETSSVTFRGGQLGTVAAKFIGGKATLAIDAATTMNIYGNVAVTLSNTVEGNIAYSAAQDLRQTGQLQVNSKDALQSVDHLTIGGKVILGGLNLALGAQDDSVQLLSSTTINGATTIDTGSGNDTVTFDGQGDTLKLNGATKVILGDGNDNLVAHGKTGTADLSGVQILDKATFDTGSGNDIASITGARFKSTLGVILGTGRNTLITDHLHVASTTKITADKSGLGDIVETGASAFGAAVTIQMGAGSVIVDGFGKKFTDLFKDILRITGLEKKLQVNLIFGATPPTDKLFVAKADKTITIAP